MEELLESVQSAEIQAYMREALASYGAGAYRGCIVLCSISVFEDLRRKTNACSSLSKDAKKIAKDIEVIVKEQKPFETKLAEKLASKKSNLQRAAG